VGASFCWMMNILIATIGSHGDVHPFIGIARVLRKRGHRVTLFAPASFQSLARRQDLDFVGIGSEEEFRRIESNPDLWHPMRGFGVIAQGVSQLNEPLYRALAEKHIPGQTVLVLSTLALGGRVAQEKLEIPAVSVHLSPGCFRSVIHPPVWGRFPVIAGMKRWNRFWYWVADTVVLDRLTAGPLNAFRTTLGLPAVRSVFGDWLHSPRRVIGLFPDWFAPRQLDWPEQTVLTGFPLYDESDAVGLDAGLEKFLEDGAPPIVFTPGSAMRHGRKFFEDSAAACKKLGRRGLFLSRHSENFPPGLPGTIFSANYAPFSAVLPRCAAVVHHAGIGTCAQSLAAGIPQLAMPMAHDQFDNAERLKRLGVAAVLPQRRFYAGGAAAALGKILDNPSIAGACAEIKKRMGCEHPIDETVKSIEQMI
jgi:rhamnosyltransferase subunit B